MNRKKAIQIGGFISGISGMLTEIDNYRKGKPLSSPDECDGHDKDELSMEELRSGIDFLYNFLRIGVALIWFVLFWPMTLICAFSFTENKLTDWFFAVVSLVALTIPWFFLGKNKKLSASLLVNSSIAVLFSFATLSFKWIGFIFVVVSLNIGLVHLCSFLKNSKAGLTDSRRTLEFKTDMLIGAVLLLFGLISLMSS